MESVPRSVSTVQRCQWVDGLKSGHVKCPINHCQQKFSSLKNIIKHYKICTGSNSGKDFEFVCKICDKSFLDHNDFTTHSSTHNLVSDVKQKNVIGQITSGINYEKGQPVVILPMLDLKGSDGVSKELINSFSPPIKKEVCPELVTTTAPEICSTKPSSQTSVMHTSPTNTRSKFVKRRACHTFKKTSQGYSSKLVRRIAASKHKLKSGSSKEVKDKKKGSLITVIGTRPRKKLLHKKKKKLVVSQNASYVCTECGITKKTVSAFKYHLASMHLSVWSLKNQSSEFNPRGAFKYSKKCFCVVCKNPFCDYGDYLQHLDTCNKEKVTARDEPVTEYSVDPDLRSRQDVQKQSGSKKCKMDVSPEDGSPTEKCTAVKYRKQARRSSALKALKKLTQDFQTFSKENYLEFEDMYQVPEDRSSHFEYIDEWKQHISKHNSVCCPFKNCNHKFYSINAIGVHVRECDKGSQYSCHSCQHKTLMESKMVEHIKSAHKAKVNKKRKLNDEDFLEDDTEDTDNTGDSSSSENLSDWKDEQVKTKYSPVKKYSTNRVFKQTRSWSRSWYKRLQTTEDPFSHLILKLSDVKQLTRNEYKSYVPTSETSIPFKVKNFFEEITPKPIDLPLFQFYTLSNNKVFLNAGGPVWSMAWANTPYNAVTNQFLALYTHRTRDETHTAYHASSSPALLQVWDCGSLSDKTNHDPNFSYGIALDYGPIWQMCWCASPSWQDPKSFKKDILPRIGLLSIACANGNVYVLSLPHPQNLSPADEAFPIYRLKPLICLESFYKNEPQESKFCCLTVDWQVLGQMNKIVAGFGDGIVSVWDIHTQSPLLKVKSDGFTSTLLPTVSFQAHFKGVQSACLFKRNPQYLVTCSHDKVTKYWDLTDISRPRNSLQRWSATDVVWPLHWPLVFISSDDCFSFGHNCVLPFDFGYFGQFHRPITLHNACIWSLDVSDWSNLLVSCDSSGLVTGLLLPSMITQYKTIKKLSVFRSILFATEYQNKSPTKNKENNRNQRKKSNSVADRYGDLKTKNGKRVFEQDDHFDSIDDLVIVFKDLLDFNGPFQQKEYDLTFSRQIPVLNVDVPNYKAIHKIKFNQNSESFSWLSAGGQSGIVRLIKMQGLEDSIDS